MKTTKSLKIEPNNLFVIIVKKPFRKSEIKVEEPIFGTNTPYLWHQDFLTQHPKDFGLKYFTIDYCKGIDPIK